MERIMVGESPIGTEVEDVSTIIIVCREVFYFAVLEISRQADSERGTIL